ncbi:MAG: hypothetical protein NTW54_03580, partial [Bacteroidetes bacterium]|nr:hypothetical protein [Bacteroidota bacterium]
MSPYYFSLLMYLIAILLYLKKKSIFIITPILVISFNIQSFLPITYALLLINYVYRHQHALREKIISYVLKNAILLLIPIAYYLSIRYFFPLAGFYKVDGYNTFNISISSLFRNFSISIVNTTLTPFYLLGKYALSDFISLFPIALISAAIAYIMFKTRLLATVPAIIKTKRHLGFSILLLIAATFPYALVNKHVTTFGYETRHSLLMIIPTLLIIVTMARYFGKYQALFFLLFSFLSITIYLKNQLLWENRYIKYQAIIYQLQKQPLLDNANNFFFTEKNKHFEMPEYLRFYECNILLKEAYRNESNLGINEESAPHNDSLINAYSQKYITRKKSLCFADYTKTSLQQEIEISDHFAEDIDVFFAYYFGSREALLEKLITLKVK